MAEIAIETNNDKIDMFCREVLVSSRQLYGESKLYDTFFKRLTNFRLENITSKPSQLKLVEEIKLLDAEWTKTVSISYIEVLHAATSRLIYLLSVEGLWEIARDAVVETVQNHVPFHTDRDHVSVKSDSLNLMNADKTIESTDLNKFRNERWLVAYVILAMYVTVPVNIARLSNAVDE